MRRLWGEPVAGVRLDPLPHHLSDGLKPGSFLQLINQAQLPAENQSKRNGVYEETADAAEYLWEEDSFPILTEVCDELQPEFANLEAASKRPVDESFFVWRSGTPYRSSEEPSQMSTLLKYFGIQMTRDLTARNFDKVLSAIQTMERLSKRCLKIGFGVNRYPFHAAVRKYARKLSESTVNLTQLAELQACLKRFEESKQSAAEMLRYDLQALKEMAREGEYPVPGGQFAPWRWAVGSDPDHVEGNLTTVYSELIQQLERDPDSTEFNPLLEKYLGRIGSLRRKHHFGPDLTSRYFLERAVYNLERIRKVDLYSLTACRCLQATIAVRMFTITHNAPPQTLGEAMSEIPTDPYRDQSLNYLLLDDKTWLIYSVGENKTDDHGDYNSPDYTKERDVGIWSDESNRFDKRKTKPVPRKLIRIAVAPNP